MLIFHDSVDATTFTTTTSTISLTVTAVDTTVSTTTTTATVTTVQSFTSTVTATETAMPTPVCNSNTWCRPDHNEFAFNCGLTASIYGGTQTTNSGISDYQACENLCTGYCNIFTYNSLTQVCVIGVSASGYSYSSDPYSVLGTYDNNVC